MNNTIKLLLSLFICQAAGIVGSLFTTPAIPLWYAGLNKPSFTPPNGLFAPVWISLFFLMGISLFLLWIRGPMEAGFHAAMGVFLLQLVLNIAWSLIFFGLKRPFLAFIDILLLWFAILLCIILFFRISRIASLLFLPYLLWVGFASILNYSIWRLNP